MSKPDFGILLALAYAAFVDELRASMAGDGFDHLHRSFGYVARALADGPMTLRALAGRLEMTSPGALKIVNDMARHGYLEKRADPDDGRVTLLSLSARGARAIEAARAFHRRFEARLGKRAGAGQVAAVRQVLGLIVEERESGGRRVALRPM